MEAATPTHALRAHFWVKSTPSAKYPPWHQEPGFYEVEWDRVLQRPKPNARGVTGYACARVCVYGCQPLGDAFRMHVCHETPCTAQWDPSRYGKKDEPLHVQRCEEPPPLDPVGPAAAVAPMPPGPAAAVVPPAAASPACPGKAEPEGPAVAGSPPTGHPLAGEPTDPPSEPTEEGIGPGPLDEGRPVARLGVCVRH